jgi:hypothetical protein
MTVNSTSTREFTIDGIVKLALQTAGLIPAGAPQSGTQWDNYSSQARDFLELEVDGLQAQGLLERAVALYDVTLVAGSSAYAMPSTTLSVVGDAMYLPPTSTSGQTVVKPMDRARYQLISDKDAQGTPSLYWAEQLAAVTVYLWPVPDEDGTLTIQRHRLLADNDDGSKTPDLERYWAKYLVNAVAHWVAMSNGIGVSRLQYLKALAADDLAIAKAQAASATPGQVVCTHVSGWNSR